MGKKMSIANEHATKPGALREIQEPDQPEISQSEIDKLEMLAALEEQPAKPIAAEASANAAANHASGVQSSDVHPSEDSDAYPFDLTSEAIQPSSIPLIELAQILDEHKMWVESGGEVGVKADLTGANLAGA